MTRRGRQRMTAAQLMAELEVDEAFHSAKRERDEVARREDERFSLLERPVVADLRRLGYQVDSAWDLMDAGTSYEDALPVLMAHLERGGYPDRVMEGMARALAVETALPLWSRLLCQYQRAKGRNERAGLAVALSVCATPAQLPDLERLITDGELGDSRISLVKAIVDVGGARGREVVERLRDHAVLGREARACVKKSPGTLRVDGVH